MSLSVRKSICLASIATALSPIPGFGPGSIFEQGAANMSALAQEQNSNTKQSVQKAEPAVKAQKPAAVQVKKLDDSSKEVLRPIPTVLQTKVEIPPATKPLEKAKAAADKKTDEKSAGGEKKAEGKTKVVTKKTAKSKSTAIGAHFVPPPPPNTPSIFNDSGDFATYNGVPIEMLSREALKDRAKEISIQYKDACRELEDHSRQKDEKIQRAAEFDGLYKEGVVSRRELEASQKEAAEVNSDIDRLSFKAKELKGVLDRINKRLTQSVVKRSGHKLIN